MIDSVPELLAALQKSKGGEVLTLAPGTYEGLAIRDLSRSPVVTITGPGAVIPGLRVERASGLRFFRLEFSAPSPGQFAYLVRESSNITFEALNVHGALDGKPQGKTSGISILKSSKIKVLDSEFQQLRRGLGVGSSQDIVISGNRFHDLQTDGVTVAEVARIRITGNEFSNFFPAEGDHPDAIQFLTSGTSQPSRDILIANNTAMRGVGRGVQGVFMRDETKRLPYENVRIQNNLLVGTGYNGIAVTGGKNIEITGNELLSYEGKANVNWILVRNADDVLVADNSAAKFGYEGVSRLRENRNKINQPVRDRDAASLVSRKRPGPHSSAGK